MEEKPDLKSMHGRNPNLFLNLGSEPESLDRLRNIGGMLRQSTSMLVLLDPSYVGRLWCPLA